MKISREGGAEKTLDAQGNVLEERLRLWRIFVLQECVARPSAAVKIGSEGIS